MNFHELERRFGVVVLVLGTGVSACSDANPEGGEGVTSTKLAATANELPFLKHLYNRVEAGQHRLFLREAYLPNAPMLEGAKVERERPIQDVDAEGNVIGEIHGNFPGWCNPATGECTGAVTDAGAAATFHAGRDFIAWADVDKVFVKELPPSRAPTVKVEVRTAAGAITSAPTIASFRDKLVVSWMELDRRQIATSDDDGATWDVHVSPDGQDSAYGHFTSLVAFNDKLYSAYVQGGSGVDPNKNAPRVQEIRFPENGPVHYGVDYLLPPIVPDPDPNDTTPPPRPPISAQSISVAAYGDSLAFAYGTAEGLHVVHTQGDVPNFLPSETWTTTTSSRGTPLAFGVSNGVARLYAQRITSTVGRVTTYVQPLEFPLPAVEQYPFGDPKGERGAGVLYNSAYGFGGVYEEFQLAVEHARPCTRDALFHVDWAAGPPANLDRYQVELNGRRLAAVLPKDLDGEAFPVFLQVIPNHDHELRVRAVFDDGTDRLSNAASYRFEPCTQRPTHVALAKTRFADAPYAYASVPEMEAMLVAANSYYAATTGSRITITGTADEVNPLPDNTASYCDEIEDGWGTHCRAGLELEALKANPLLDPKKSEYDVTMFLIGGLSLGHPARISKANVGSMNGDVEAEPSDPRNGYFIHEIAHALGLIHSGYWKCPTSYPPKPFPPDLFDTDASAPCQATETEDIFDPMGAGHVVDAYKVAPFRAFHGEVLGYIASAQHIDVTESGEYLIASIDQAADGISTVELRIPVGADVNHFYSLEYRGPDSGDGLVLAFHQAGLEKQYATTELMRIGTLGVKVLQAYRDPYRKISIEFLEALPDGLARVGVSLATEYDGDDDDDGIVNGEDNCRNEPNPEQCEQDGDYIGNACDPNADGDLLPNDEDNCPFRGNNLQQDSDGDGIGDACENDAGEMCGENSDGDSFPDEWDNCPAVPNSEQEDFDADGVGDACDDNSLVANAGPDQTLECQAAGRASATLDGSASAAPTGSLSYLWSAPVTLTNANQSLATGSFPLGTTTATLTVSQGSLQASDSLLVKVADTIGPVLTVPPDVVATSCASVSLGQATAVDACGGSVTITNDKPSTFRAGIYLVTWIATDARGRQSTRTQRVSVGLGDSAACCPAGTNVIQGTSNNDSNLVGTSGRDCILGKGGQDVIRGMGGDDVLSGGGGDDTVEGGAGNDFIDAGSGQDTLRGQDGDDVLLGQDGDDSCYGGNQNDTIHGSQGQDRLYGEAGADSLYGDDGFDTLEGGSGDDLLNGGAATDQCIGGPDNDRFELCETQTN
jgi:hypothetical protein